MIGQEHGVDVEAVCKKAKDVEVATGLRLIIDTEDKLLTVI